MIDHDPAGAGLVVNNPPKGARLRVGNEFAQVDLWVVEAQGDTLLLLHDVKRDIAVVIDPLELEAITRLSHEDFAVLVDPSFSGFVAEHVRDAF